MFYGFVLFYGPFACFLFIRIGTVHTSSKHTASISFLVISSPIMIILVCALPCYSVIAMVNQYINNLPMWTTHIEFMQLLAKII